MLFRVIHIEPKNKAINLKKNLIKIFIISYLSIFKHEENYHEIQEEPEEAN